MALIGAHIFKLKISWICSSINFFGYPNGTNRLFVIRGFDEFFNYWIDGYMVL